VAGYGQVLIDVGDGTLIPVVPASTTPPATASPVSVSPAPAPTTPPSVTPAAPVTPPPLALSSDACSPAGVNVPTGQFGQDAAVRVTAATTQPPATAAPGPTTPTRAAPTPPMTGATASPTQPAGTSRPTPAFDIDAVTLPGVHVRLGRFGQNVAVTELPASGPMPLPVPVPMPQPAPGPTTQPDVGDLGSDALVPAGAIALAGHFGSNVAVDVVAARGVPGPRAPSLHGPGDAPGYGPGTPPKAALPFPLSSRFLGPDQGVDFFSTQTVKTMAAGRVYHISPPGAFGPGTEGAVYVHLDKPVSIHGRSYQNVYYAERAPLVQEGDRVSVGQPIMAAGLNELGFASDDQRHPRPKGPLNVVPATASHGRYTKPTTEGYDFLDWLHRIARRGY